VGSWNANSFWPPTVTGQTLVVVPSGWFTMTQAAEAGACPAATVRPSPGMDRVPEFRVPEFRSRSEVVGTQYAPVSPVAGTW